MCGCLRLTLRGAAVAHTAVNAVVKSLCNKFEPRKDTPEARTVRSVIAKATREFLFNLDQPVGR